VPCLELISLPDIPEVRPGANLAGLLAASLSALQFTPHPQDILVVAQKVVSKAEGRLVRLADITPSVKAMELAAQAHKDPRLAQLILDESRVVLRVRPGIVIVEHRLGMIHANAGIDQSNLPDNRGGEWALLLPLDPDASAKALSIGLAMRIGVTMGVIISDSMGRAWRLGTTCAAIGCAGVPVLRDQTQEEDLHGRVLQNTWIAVADQLAAAAGLLMGESGEGYPAVLIRGLPPGASDTMQEAHALLRPRELDLFR